LIFVQIARGKYTLLGGAASACLVLFEVVKTGANQRVYLGIEEIGLINYVHISWHMGSKGKNDYT